MESRSFMTSLALSYLSLESLFCPKEVIEAENNRIIRKILSFK